MGLHFLDRVVLVLTGSRIVVTVVLQAEERKIVLNAIRPSTIKMGDLTLLHSCVAVQMKTNRTPPATLGQDPLLHVRRRRPPGW